MYSCMHACMYARVCIQTYVHVYTCTHVRVYVRPCVCMCACMHACVYVFQRVFLFTPKISVSHVLNTTTSKGEKIIRKIYKILIKTLGGRILIFSDLDLDAACF